MPSIIVVDYDPMWPVLYEEERARIQALIGDYIEEIQHMGSTSVPGLGAKPIIDIMVVIRSLDLVEHTVQPLASISYEYHGEYGIPGRHLFSKPAGVSSFDHTHHLHMIERSHPQREYHLLFRDYLRGHPEAAREYNELKKALAVKFGADRTGYTNAKTDFIASILAQARAERSV